MSPEEVNFVFQAAFVLGMMALVVIALRQRN